MSSYFAVVQKVYQHLSGRDRDKAYVHVIGGARTFGGTFEELLQLAPWNDPDYNDYAVEITEAEHQAIQNGFFPLTWGTASLPKWQWNGSERGSWSDPEDEGSMWRSGVPISDDRWIVKIYDKEPSAPSAVHVAADEFVEGDGDMTRYVKLFNSDGTASKTNAQDQRVNIAGRRMVFDFTRGVTTLQVSCDQEGQIDFLTDHQYRVVGPNGENSYIATVCTRVLRVK